MQKVQEEQELQVNFLEVERFKSQEGSHCPEAEWCEAHEGQDFQAKFFEVKL